MNSAELIELIKKTDPTGEREVVVNTNDGYAYNVGGYAKNGDCMEGVVDEDSDNDDILILDATN